MSKSNGNGLNLSGDGAAYVRVSDDQQDTQRQYAALHAFEKRHGVTIPKQHWFKDEGWARDTADRRPDFQRLMKLAEAGRVKWIVVDALDRFGTKSAKQLFAYLYRLEEAGCRLFDAAGKEWTGEDDATEITAWVGGKESAKEQRNKSHRVLGGKVAKARRGEWQGGPVRLGFDVACYSREAGKELWRVTCEGRGKRLKVYPDGRTERFDDVEVMEDGKRKTKPNFPTFQSATEVLRIAPSKDLAKVNAAVSVFKRYATESVGFTALAHYRNGLGWRNGYGGYFQHQQIEEMLRDPIYLGYYTWNRLHCGKFGRYAGEQVVADLNYGEKVSRNAEADWVQSERLFPPLVDQKTWATVQRKLGERTKRTNAPPLRRAVPRRPGLLPQLWGPDGRRRRPQDDQEPAQGRAHRGPPRVLLRHLLQGRPREEAPGVQVPTQRRLPGYAGGVRRPLPGGDGPAAGTTDRWARRGAPDRPAGGTGGRGLAGLPRRHRAADRLPRREPPG
jgi:DNA invertase Pin-like site-specific DNA recombinase